MTDDSDDSIDWENYETGPFCIHWANVEDCDQICKCGHECWEHDGGGGGCCNICECKKFEEEDE